MVAAVTVTRFIFKFEGLTVDGSNGSLKLTSIVFSGKVVILPFAGVVATTVIGLGS